MKKLLIIALCSIMFSCGNRAREMREGEEWKSETTTIEKYKVGDVVCVRELGTRGIVQHKSIFSDKYHGVRYYILFVDKCDHLYNEEVYERDLTDCK